MHNIIVKKNHFLKCINFISSLILLEKEPTFKATVYPMPLLAKDLHRNFYLLTVNPRP